MKSFKHKAESPPKSGRHLRRRREESIISAPKERTKTLPKPEWIKIRLDDVVKEVV